jgi:pimeloyl-ACP methyl ester carboxylesterase
VQEREFQVNGRKIVALCHGKEGDRPILALHGWLDNAESFTPLAQQLDGFQVVALDLAGHGRSDHRSADGEYSIWSDLPDVQAVVDELDWQTFDLLGHSRGALIGGMFAATLPARVDHLMLLDSFQVQAAQASECVNQLATFLRERDRYLSEPARVFAAPEVAIKARARSQFGPGSVDRIVHRNLQHWEGGWCWTTDARLKGASSFKLTNAHNAAIISAWTMPVLLLLAEQGLGSRLTDMNIPDSVCAEVMAGGHHFHMDESVLEIAERLRQFVGDRKS